ncbi:ABC transporter ATP-binding protein, partial [termite gut metagenome]
SLVIDELIQSITREYNMTTIINTHDMNSVMGIGEKIIYIFEGRKEWEGTKDGIFTANNQRLNDFIFASAFFRKVKEAEIHNITDDNTEKLESNVKTVAHLQKRY